MIMQLTSPRTPRWAQPWSTDPPLRFAPGMDSATEGGPYRFYVVGPGSRGYKRDPFIPANGFVVFARN